MISQCVSPPHSKSSSYATELSHDRQENYNILQPMDGSSYVQGVFLFFQQFLFSYFLSILPIYIVRYIFTQLIYMLMHKSYKIPQASHRQVQVSTPRWRRDFNVIWTLWYIIKFKQLTQYTCKIKPHTLQCNAWSC